LIYIPFFRTNKLRLFATTINGQKTDPGFLLFGNVFVAVIASPRANAYKSLTQFGDFPE